MNKEMDIPPCPVCGTRFNNIFEATDHLVEEGGEEEFDPVLQLSSGYALMVGSLLRCLYSHASNADKIRYLIQETYATLYAASINPSSMRFLVEDIIVRQQMEGIDVELKRLLRNGKHDG